MKPIFVSLTLAIFLPASTFAAGSEAIIKQHAKELRDQNNVRQGVPPPAPAPQPAKPSAAQPAALTLMAKLQADLAAIKPNSQVTAEQKQQLNRDLQALATGPKKPSPGATSKLAGDIAAALAQKVVETIRRFYDAGARHIILDFVGPYEERFDEIERFAAEAMPLLDDLRRAHV